MILCTPLKKLYRGLHEPVRAPNFILVLTTATPRLNILQGTNISIPLIFPAVLDEKGKEIC
jgi:hypothetical protein